MTYEVHYYVIAQAYKMTLFIFSQEKKVNVFLVASNPQLFKIWNQSFIQNIPTKFHFYETILKLLEDINEKDQINHV